jgi:putative endonuclease
LTTANDKWLVYLLRCADGSLYCGVTNHMERRLAAHNSGNGAKYTRSKLPVELVCCSPAMSKSDAFKLEYRVKRAPSEMKQQLVGSQD